MPIWRETHPGAEELRVAVMGCVVNGPGEIEARRHRDLAAGHVRGAGRAGLHRRPPRSHVAWRRPRRRVHRDPRGLRGGAVPERPSDTGRRRHCRRARMGGDERRHSPSTLPMIISIGPDRRDGHERRRARGVRSRLGLRSAPPRAPVAPGLGGRRKRRSPTSTPGSSRIGGSLVGRGPRVATRRPDGPRSHGLRCGRAR